MTDCIHLRAGCRLRRMHPRTRALPVIALMAAMLTFACADDATEQPAPTVPPQTVAVSATPSGPAPPAGTSATPAPLKVGATHSFTSPAGERVGVTLLAHKGHGGQEYYGIQVRACNEGTTLFSVSTVPWLLSYSGGEELSRDSVVGGGLLEPAFAQGELAPGKCRKGWITYLRAGNPDGAEYRIDGETSARWEW